MMKHLLLSLLTSASAITAFAAEPADSIALHTPVSHVESEFQPQAALAPELSQRVIVGNDTVPVIIPQRNYGRFDRGLFNFLFIPKDQWAFGLTASYGEFSTEDVQILSLLKNLDFKGKMYTLRPEMNYFIRNNQSLGLKFTYSRGEADLSNLSVDFDEDINFSLHDVSFYTQEYGVALFYRNYIGFSSLKRFAIFNEVALGFASGSSRFKRLYNDEPRDTKTLATTASLNFSPGLCMFIMDYISFNISFGVFGVKIKHETQSTNGVKEGSRTSSGANFKFNLLNINFGISVHI